MYRLAFISFHGCPVARLGQKDSGGMNVYVLQIARDLAARGNLVDVYTRYHDLSDPRVIDLGNGARVIHIEAGPHQSAKETLYGYIPEFIRNLENYRSTEHLNYDLIHSHYWLSGSVGMYLGQSWKIPHVTTFHTLAKAKLRARVGELESNLRVSEEQKIVSEANSIIVSTEQEKQDLIQLYGASKEKIEVVSPGVDTDQFRPKDKIEARKELGFTDDKVVLYVGRIEPLKGLDILITAFAELDDISDVKLVIVGGNLDAPDEELYKLKKDVVNLGLEEKVIFSGAVKNSDLDNYYNSADVFVLPSHHESFGLVALEAMACGVPVVVSRVGGLTSFVQDGVTGYLVPWRCSKPFAQRIDMLLSNEALRLNMGVSSRAKALGMTWNNSSQHMLDIYSRVVEKTIERVVGG